MPASVSKKFVGIFIFVFMTIPAFSQIGYYEDAFRFSEFRSTGSARINGLGGAQMSLGGDVSNIHGNPAGLGFFRRSEFSITSSFGPWNTETNFLNQVSTDRTGNFSIPNISVVISNPKGPLHTGAFKGGTFGFSTQRINQFNTQFNYFSDIEGDVSIIDHFIQQASGIPESQIENAGLVGLAYSTFLINPITEDPQGNPIANPTEYDSFVLGFPFQDELVFSEGRNRQTSFSYGANFNHKIFVGAGLGLVNTSFFQRKSYGEEFFGEPLLTHSLNESLRSTSIGTNLNFGLIFKPVDIINLGFNFQSPTWYRFNERYEARMVNVYDNFFFEPENITLGTESAETPIFLTTYNLNTPLRLSGGATFFLGKNGFLTADIDYLDYSTSRISSRDFRPEADNQEIRSLYTQTINYRFGGEFRYEVFRLRAGYALYGDPFAFSQFDRSTQQFSGGLGVRVKKVYVDFTYSSMVFNQLYNSFPVFDNANQNIGPISEVRNVINNGMFTLGFNF